MPHIKLHLACGSNYREGWINIDTSRAVRTDLVFDIKSVRKHFQDETVSEAMIVHALSYLRLCEARAFFKDIYSLLKLGGVFILEQPDLSNCYDRMRESKTMPDQLDSYIEGIRGIFAFDQEQLGKKESYIPYAFGWTSWHLRYELMNAGFHECEISPGELHAHSWRDVRITCKKV